MGLDMYLYRKTYICNSEWTKEDIREAVTLTKGGKPHPTIKSERVKYVIEEMGYWRKANQIHGWFVQNVQDGQDDCSAYKVTREQLEQLRNDCKEVLEDKTKAYKLLPPQNGFFFGSTDLDEWYFEQLNDTVNIIDQCLSDEDVDEFEYRSSW
jgi:hypothetical protein